MTEYFHTEREARAWYQDAVNDKYNNIIPPFDMIASDIVYHNAALPSFNDMTVDEWFEFWMKNLVPDLRSNTRRNYNDRYRFNIQPVIGKMKIRDVRTMETYVHVTDDSKLQAVKQFEENTPESLKVAQLVYLVSDDSKNWCQIGVKPHC